MRTIEEIILPPNVNFVGDGFRVHHYIPGIVSMQRMNPFLMMDYNSPFYFPPSDKPRGVGVHPHKGFETVTIAYQGKIKHTDSSGGGGVIDEGDVQWMTAASGVLHKEFHEEEFSQKGGMFQMVQLWVNLPSEIKKTEPKYQSIKNFEIPKIQENGCEIEIISGEYTNTKGAASTFTPINLFNVKGLNSFETKFSFPSHFNTCIVVIEGSINVNNQLVETNQFVLMKNDGEDFIISGYQNSKCLILSGEPINEPIAAYGPFVMNTKEEIIDAYNDFNNGKFGYLED